MTLPSSLESKILTAFGACAVVVVLLSALTWKLARDAGFANDLVTQTNAVINAIEHSRADTVHIELSTQNYRLSGDASRLTERDQVIQAREIHLNLIKALTASDAAQALRWTQLREVLNQRLAISAKVAELRKTQGFEAATAFALQAPLQETRARTYAILDEMRNAEGLLLTRQSEAQSAANRLLVNVGIVASALLILVLAAAFVLIRKQLLDAQQNRTALAESEENLATTLYSIGDAVIATDAQGRITRMNPVAQHLTGWSLADASGRAVEDVFTIICEDTQLPAEAPVAKVLATGTICELANHTALVARDGKEIPIADSAAPIRDASGTIRGVVLVFRDVREARNAQKAIQENNARLEELVLQRTDQLRTSRKHLLNVINNVPALIAYVDARQQYVYVNEQYRKRFAPETEDLTACTVRSVLGEQRYAIAAPLIAKVLAGEPQSYDWEPFPGVWQLINYVPNQADDGRILGYYVLGTDITERRRMEDALRNSKQQLARVLEGSDQGYWDWNVQTNVFEVSDRWQTMLGYQPGEMQVDTSHWHEHVHPDDYPKALASIQRHLRGEAPSHAVEMRCRTKDGAWRWIQTRGRVVAYSADGQALMMSGTHTDIEERKRHEIEHQDASVVFDNSYEGIMVAGADQLISKVNPAFTRITGYQASDVIGKSPKILSSGRHGLQFYRNLWTALNKNDFWFGEIWNKRKSGEIYAALESISVVRDQAGQVQHYISLFTDISQIKAHEAELSRAANYDPLTDLPNRRLLSDRLKQAIIRSTRSGKSCAVCFLDLDGFKVINDTFGHATGDLLLIGIAAHLKEILRADDTLARLGGDEFVLLLAEVASTKECALVLDRVLEAVRRPVDNHGQVLSLSASIGVSLFPDDNADPDTLLRHADQAMYLAKQAGKNRYQLFDAAHDRVAQSHREFLERMKQGLSHNEFVLYYQPKVDMGTGAVIGVEALIRWNHPERGLLAPGEFLPHLHGSDLEMDFGEWVMESALTQMEAWSRLGLTFKVSVNVSASHLLQADFTENLRALLSKHAGVDPSRFELEVLETAALADMQQAAEILHRCKTFGVGFSLDDFGTGYSSLTYLRKLPVDTLKIDQSFVRDMLTNPDDLEIIKGVIDLASAFQRMVIAEGVETLDHGAMLLRLGCRYAQGYGISKPMPSDQVAPWCAHWHGKKPWASLHGTPVQTA